MFHYHIEDLVACWSWGGKALRKRRRRNNEHILITYAKGRIRDEERSYRRREICCK